MQVSDVCAQTLVLAASLTSHMSSSMGQQSLRPLYDLCVARQRSAAAVVTARGEVVFKAVTCCTTACAVLHGAAGTVARSRPGFAGAQPICAADATITQTSSSIPAQACRGAC